MGTVWTVKWVQPAPPLAAAEVERRVAARLEQLEQQFSTYRSGSDLMRFNATPGTGWVPVPAELAEAARRARELSAVTDGAFDVTVWPLVQLWGFGAQRRAGALPTEADIARCRALVDWRALEQRASPPALRRTRPGVSADFSSLAKGLSADAVSALLNGLGATNHLVLLAGDVRSAGRGPAGAGWRVAIEQPEGGVARVVSLTGGAVATSGDYRNFFEHGGRRYGHILDPRTGEPVQGDLAAVSVVAETSADASSRATALFVLGAEAGFRLAEARGWSALFQVRRGDAITLRPTPAFEGTGLTSPRATPGDSRQE
jgi:thiamine biosynthesis lipoprotein